MVYRVFDMRHCSVPLQFIIITMKQWLKRTQSPPGARSQRSHSHSRQFKQVITKLSEGYPPGHFLAYCLVSKESSYGIFLNERLLVLDTQARQLRYYSHIPQLPLRHHRDLPAPKEVVPIRPGVEFQQEKVRIGHVTIRWEEYRQERMWKLIMGNNQIAKDFNELFMQILLAQTEQAKAKQMPIGKQYKISKPYEPVSPSVNNAQGPRYEERLRQSPATNKHQLRFATPQQKKEIYPQQSDLIKESSAQRLNISLHDSRPLKEEPQGYLSSRFKALEIQPFPKIQKQQNSLQKSGLMAAQWLQAKQQSQRIISYNKFVRICSRKIQLMMQNFISSHLMHEEYNRLHLIRDNDIEVYYSPLISSTEEQSFSSLFANIQQEAAMIEEWQCLDYLSTFKQVGNTRVLCPMACMLTYKSFKFFCKNSLEMYPHKQRLVPPQCQQEVSALQQLAHLPIRNGAEQIYLIELGNERIIYIDHASGLPKITPYLPVPTTYIQLFLTRGVVSNQKDLQAISQHISSKLVSKTLHNLAQKPFTTSCEVMDFICQSGLSQHYLSFFLDKQEEYDYVDRLIASQLVACAAEWQIRRRMQIELFKKRQFGFAINQVRTAVSLLLQEDKYFITVVNEILKGVFNYTLPNLPIRKYIQPQTMTISLFNRLGFDCRGAFLDAQEVGNAWTQNYINDFIELTPFVHSELLRYDAFSRHQRVLMNLIGQINNQINTSDISLEDVLGILALRKNNSGLYPVSPNYAILPRGLKMKINYYLSHFIAPSFEPAPQQSLQAMIYGDTFALTSPHPHYYTHTIQHLTTLNKVRWLARMKYLPRVEELLEKQVEQAITWSQLPLLTQVYAFAAKLKLRQGEISSGLECSLKAMQYALRQYEKEPNVLMELIIAEQAFEAANFHFTVHNFSKALDLYSTVEEILAKISTSGDNITLNPQFLDLYVNKCAIHLLFGDYAQCFEQCLSSIKTCSKFNSKQAQGGVFFDQQFKIYEILFRCYQIKNMRKQLTDVTCICCQRFFQDQVMAGKQPSIPILGGLVKMLWISAIKQMEALSTTRNADLAHTAKLKTIYLKKVRRELKQLRESLNYQHRYSPEEAATFMARKTFKYPQPVQDCRLILITIDCLSEVSLNTRSLHSYKLYDTQSLHNQWLTLEMLAVLAGYDYLIGAIDDYLRIYDFQP